MKRYVAFLRGVNVGGKNTIPMKELKKRFEELGFKEVKTYLNSGNVLFSSSDSAERCTDKIESMIHGCLGFAIPVLCMPKEALEDILQNAPAWWGGADKEIYDNLIFIIPPATFSDVFHEIGEPKEGLERIEHYRNAIFWSFGRKEYRKTNWWSKTASARISGKLTIRTANTVRKLAGM